MKMEKIFILLFFFKTISVLPALEKSDLGLTEENRSSELKKKNLILAKKWFLRKEFFRSETEFMRLNFISLNNKSRPLFWRSNLYLNRIKLVRGQNSEALVGYIALEPLANLLYSKELIQKDIYSQFQHDMALAYFFSGFYKKAGMRFDDLYKNKGFGSKKDPDRYRQMREVSLESNEYFLTGNGGYAREKRERWVSGLMSSILPGSGQVYNGAYRQGILSFLFVGLFSGISYLSYHNNQKITSYLTLYLALVFYGHNINSSLESADRYNESIANEKMRQFKLAITEKIDWWPR